MTDWLDTIQNRRTDLVSDRQHPSFTWETFYPTLGVTRQSIVDFYEQAYNELAEAFAGHLDHIKEQETDMGNKDYRLQRGLKLNELLQEDLDRTHRRLNGLLSLIEEGPLEDAINLQRPY